MHLGLIGLYLLGLLPPLCPLSFSLPALDIDVNSMVNYGMLSAGICPVVFILWNDIVKEHQRKESSLVLKPRQESASRSPLATAFRGINCTLRFRRTSAARTALGGQWPKLQRIWHDAEQHESIVALTLGYSDDVSSCIQIPPVSLISRQWRSPPSPCP